MLSAMLLLFALQAPGQQTTLCLGDDTSWLKFDYNQFESARDKLPRDNECLGHQVYMIDTYRNAHRSDMKPRDVHNSLFHQGQLLAKLGRSSEAIPFLLAGVAPGRDPGDFADYALGTAAFLNHDREALESARARLSKQAGSDDINVDVLGGLLACFDEPYTVAYNVKCRPSHR